MNYVRNRPIGTPNGATGETQSIERLWACHRVHKVQIDVEEIGLAVGMPYNVLVPDLLGQRACHDELLRDAVGHLGSGPGDPVTAFGVTPSDESAK